MKSITLATLIAFLGTTSSAVDFPMGDHALSIGAVSDINYTTGVEDWAWTATPYVGVNVFDIALLVETDVDMLNLYEGSVFTGVDLTTTYSVPNTNLSLYTEVSSDKDFEFGDITMGAKFSF